MGLFISTLPRQRAPSLFLAAANLNPRSLWRQVKNSNFAGIAGEQLT
jgi:hypothetical protein